MPFEQSTFSPARVQILIGDVRERLRDLPDESVHCVVTSPPYFGLRDYGTAQWEGGDPVCDHLGEPMRTRAYVNSNFGTGSDVKNAEGRQPFKSVCGKCGAFRADKQIGLEKTPDAFVAQMVGVFHEVRRVLRKDGTLWLNLGDSYATGGGSVGNAPGGGKQGESWRLRGVMTPPNRMPLPGLKPKDLIGIPWRVAFALQADGWYLRQDIIWHKPNPMPESVRDRCTKAHEYLFLLSKSERYFYDIEAIREDKGANRRSVWTITTQPFAEAHFATFPPDLPELCIKAGTSEKGCCPKCGKGWVRMVERVSSDGRRALVSANDRFAKGDDGKPLMGDNAYTPDELERGSFNAARGVLASVSAGFAPSCSCPSHEPIPATVIDPFFGAGTTGLVADRLGRNCIGIELNPGYAAIAEKRIHSDAPLFVNISAGAQP